jgi:ABC-type sugar transport system ATPase subunit
MLDATVAANITSVGWLARRDGGVKAEMHQIIRKLAGVGKIVLICSTDPAELAEVCDRVVAFRRGRVSGSLTREDLSEHSLLHAMNAGAQPAA